MTAGADTEKHGRRVPADVADRDYRMLIGGQWLAAADGKTFACTDPFSEETWGQVPLAGAADVDAAVAAARQAFDDGGWPETSPGRRAQLLRRLAQLIEENGDRLVRQQIYENGKLISEMGPGIGAFAGDCHFFAGLAESHAGWTIPTHMPNMTTFTRREPIGVVAAITPWNTPLNLLGWKLFPALAAGNTVVVKPSEVTPTSTLLLGELIEEAGFPPGVVNIVTGAGETGQALVAHEGVDKIAFTGSTATGKAIARQAAERLARVSLELGGKSPNIVFADANIDNAVNGVMAGIFAATGQSCMAGSRVLVERPVFDDVARLLVERGEKMIAGDPLDAKSQLGPLASKQQLEKVLGYFKVAEDENLPCLTGGKRLDRPGYFVAPTVYGPVSNDCRLAREEVFGPVISLIPFEGEEEAVRIANDTAYGLAAGVWTESLGRAHRMVPKLRAGTVWVNNYRMIGHGMPFGGMKESGLGRENGLEALSQYTELKSVWIDGGNRVHFPVG